MPESPVYLRTKHRYVEAEKSAAWLKLPPALPITAEKADFQLAQLDKIVEKKDSIKTKSIFFTRPVIMPLMIGLSLLVLQQISGIDAIIFFTVEIFHSSGMKQQNLKKRTNLISIKYFIAAFSGSSVNDNLATILVGLVQLISNILALFVVDKAGRKPLLIVSAIVMSISMAGMGTS